MSIASPLMQPSPNGRRVGIRIVTFEACSGFTRVTARRIAQPPKATFVTRLRPYQLPGQAARQLPDLSTIIRVEPSSTGDSRLRGALPISDIYRRSQLPNSVTGTLRQISCNPRPPANIWRWAGCRRPAPPRPALDWPPVGRGRPPSSAPARTPANTICICHSPHPMRPEADIRRIVPKRRGERRLASLYGR